MTPVFRVIILYLAFLILTALIRQRRRAPKTWVPPKTTRPPKRVVLTAGREPEFDAGANLEASPAESRTVSFSQEVTSETSSSPISPLSEEQAVPVTGLETAAEFLRPQNFLTGFILLEVLEPPRARRSQPQRYV
ncbi:MAG: hypothetical protein PWQ41_123 [Bacillota bacterium]|nr:hypothetical protein [Bacillota bacterium]MDK2924349.1 hypothetical protein [Bacillota bacterium]